LKRSSFDITQPITGDAARALIESVFEASTQYSIIAADNDGRIILWNEGARRLYGYDHDEVAGGMDLSQLHVAEDRSAGIPREIMELALVDGQWEGVLPRQRRDGSRFPARVVLTPRMDALGTPLGFLLISKDISEEVHLTQELERTQLYTRSLLNAISGRKAVERELRETNLALEEASLAKNRFLANMSHELRTPLNAIIGFTGTLLMELPGPLNSEQNSQLETVQTNGRHLLAIINDLLDLGKIQSGKVELQREPVLCQNVLEEVAASQRALARDKGLRLELAMPAEAIVLRTDRRALKQILLNLVNNAIKFTDQGTVRLEVGNGRGDGATVFTVVDTGLGFALDMHEKLFAAFEQLDIQSRREGTGLGLYISQKLAALLGGHIECESTPGAGSTFSLRLTPGPDE
jgi:protein-histidine pros-kinase